LYSEQANSMKEVEEIFDNRVKTTNNIEKIKLSSEEASKMFENESLDFVYIDGDHSIKGIETDLNCWYPKIKSSGIISGHDYTMFDVGQAVNLFCKKIDRLPLKLFPDYTWCFMK
jgi:hypothetical protein